MRKWSRAVAVLCIVYLVALLLFHRHLGPINDAAIDDYVSNREESSGAHLLANNSSARPRGPTDLRKQLRQLESGMTQLEKEISDVKLKLAEEADARARQQERARERHQKEQEAKARERPHTLPLEQQQQRLLFEQQERQRQQRHQLLFEQQPQEQQQQQQLQDRQVQNPQQVEEYFGVQGQYDYDDQMQFARRLRQQQERLFRQPFSDRVPPAAFPLLPDGIRIRGFGDHVIGSRDGGGVRPIEEDYTNSSLVKIGEGVAVYTAYHDDRLADQPYVRLIVILSAPKPSRGVLCHFDTPGVSTVSVRAEQYELCENHKKRYLGFIYSCPVPRAVGRAEYKLSVSMVHSPARKVLLPLLHVTPPDVREGRVSEERHQYKYNYSVCVSPLFGSVLAKRLVEFLELTRILGVQQVFFYDFHISSVIHRVLSFYQDKGWVTVLPWKLPPTMNIAHIWYHGQLVSNNDCLYRTMALSAFTTFHDIDEFIIPHQQGIRTWSELFPPAFPNDTCGFSFKSAFYDPGVSDTYPDDLMTPALTARPAMLSRVRTKVMVAPRRVFEVGIHHISKQFLEHWAPRQYDPNRALLHHYRECMRDYGMRCENWVKDTIIKDKYLPELRVNFQEMLRTLKL